MKKKKKKSININIYSLKRNRHISGTIFRVEVMKLNEISYVSSLKEEIRYDDIFK